MPSVLSWNAFAATVNGVDLMRIDEKFSK